MKAPLLPKGHEGKNRPNTTTAHSQAIYLQSLVIKATFEEGLKPAEVSGLVRAWCDVNEERRKLAMRPLPRSIDVSKLAKRGRRQAPPAPAEPAEPGPGAPPVTPE